VASGLAVCLFVSSTVQASPINGFSDLNFWGSGANQAALVIDFQDGKTSESFAWGYQFDGGSVTGAQMMIDIAASDPNLTVAYSGNATAGFFLSSIAYFDGVDNHSLVNSWGATPETSTAWGYYQAEGAGNLPGSWSLSPTGASDRTLAEGSWDAWGYGTYDATWSHVTPPSGDVMPAAIPEPRLIALFLGGVGVLIWLRRLRVSC
jgi:hypothetical protein